MSIELNIDNVKGLELLKSYNLLTKIQEQLVLIQSRDS